VGSTSVVYNVGRPQPGKGDDLNEIRGCSGLSGACAKPQSDAGNPAATEMWSPETAAVHDVLSWEKEVKAHFSHPGAPVFRVSSRYNSSF
jgi:hypothetical protein